jgi:hypothetical protein
VIPASAIHFNDDGTAWSLLHELAQYVPATEFPEVWLDRSCDTCGGTGTWRALFADTHGTCPDCDGTGRHTFTVEVAWQTEVDAYQSETLRVSVVTVLPIVKHDEHSIVGRYIVQMESGAFYLMSNEDFPVTSEQITLPPDAKVGDWSVKLEVHQ